MKKGFTLVELLAVIVILAIILVIAIPNIAGLVESAKNSSFEAETRMIIKTLETKKALDGNYNLTGINATNIEEEIGVSPVNYKSVAVQIDEGKPYITIEGQGRWEGLKACGTKEKLIVGKEPYCAPLTPPDSCFDFDSSTGTITGYDFDTCPSEVAIPSKIGGVTVEHIGQAAFILAKAQYCYIGKYRITTSASKSLSYVHYEGDGYDYCVITSNTNGHPITKLYLPGTIKTIGTSAFARNQITNLVIPNSVTHIGDYAFSNNQIAKLTLSNNLSAINTCTFCSNLITKITVPDSVAKIKGISFSYNQLTSVHIGSGVETIVYNPFISNPNLTTITVDSSNSNYKSVNNAIYTKDGTVLITGVSSMSNNIESTTLTIEDGAFSEMGLTSVTLPNGIAIINDGVFRINQLSSITIPSSVNNIKFGALQDNNLTSITMEKAGITIEDNLLTSNNSFRTSYIAGGAGTYTGAQTGTWTKQQ